MTVESYGATAYCDQPSFYPISPSAEAAKRAVATQYATSPASAAGRKRSEAERQAMILDHASLVEYVARRFVSHLPPSMSRQDVLGYGTIGLIEAVDRFDASVGVRFETFAARRIWGSIVDALREQGFLPRNAAKRVREMNQALATLEQELSRPPTHAEIARRLGTDERGVRSTLYAAQVGVVSLDMAVGDNGEGDFVTLRDVLADETSAPSVQVEEAEQTRILAAEINALPQRERLVLSLYYHEELTLREIGHVLGISESRVCQLHATAIRRLRAAMAPEQRVAIQGAARVGGRR